MRRIMAITALTATTACAHTEIRNQPDDPCGQFSSTASGAAPFASASDEYQKYQVACAQRRFAETIAAQRRAQVDAAWRVVGAIEADRRAPDVVADELLRQVDAARARTTLRVATLAPSGSADQSLRAAIGDRVASRLVAGDVPCYERARVDAVLREQRFQLTDAVDEQTATRIGRLVGATHVLLTTVVALDRGAYAVTARLVAVEDARVLAAASHRYTP